MRGTWAHGVSSSASAILVWFCPPFLRGPTGVTDIFSAGEECTPSSPVTFIGGAASRFSRRTAGGLRLQCRQQPYHVEHDQLCATVTLAHDVEWPRQLPPARRSSLVLAEQAICPQHDATCVCCVHSGASGTSTSL